MFPMTAASHRWTSRLAAIAALVLAALPVVLLPATPASAHAVLVSTSPVADAVLPNAPAEVVLTFSESVRQVPDRVRVIAPDGQRVDQGEPVFNGAVVSVTVDQQTSRGTYLVSYRVISADGHPVTGGFTYSVGAPSAVPTDSGGAETDPLVSRLIQVAKFAGYVGLLLIVGPVLVLTMLWPRRLSRAGPGRLVWAGLGLVAAATLAAIWLQAPYVTGGGLADADGAALRDVLGSSIGAAMLVRLGVLAAAAVLIRPLLAGTDGSSDRILLGVLAVIGAFTWPLAGHPAASPVPAVSVVVDAVHLAGMAVWLGGLLMLAVFLLRQADERELGAILPIWSRWAALAVCGLLLAGTVQALIEVGTFGALVGTTYGRLLLAKIGLFLVVLAVAAYSRQLVRNRTAAGQPGRMRQAIVAELAVTAVVLAVTAVLVQTTPARTAVADDLRATSTYFSTTLTSDIYSLQIEVDPARRGNNSVHLYAYTPDNRPQPVIEWQATAALPASGVEPIEIPLLPLTDNHATGEISLPTAGDWELRITVRISDIDQATVSTTVAIS
ncbi:MULTISPECIES: copper resistance CopC/CopD family protein [unclassified Solwaraspora]|uniref:copper resistance CopC/CopD family protein n=1 Tax=unclassified Solwaraspora TaxID=2627926 RepID=UPI00259BA12A|nr:copper resistance protein CopC [Solwaraspora sp. WMMA2056]WJK40272.1 copper resistance protein CopC [Solwaraspora sp. WMMA2056]